MEYLYQNLSINFIMEGQGNSIILLHGWGHNSETFAHLINTLRNDYTVYAIDFPGFGLSDEPPQAWSVQDYCDLLKSFIKDLRINRPILLGHSFGGRVAIKYASATSNISKLILVDSAGLLVNRSIKFYLKRWKYKATKHFYLLTKNKIGLQKLFDKNASTDYKSASDIMRGTLKKVVNEDLKRNVKRITCETLIIWGENDMVTPVKAAEKMQKLISNCGLIRLKGVGHFPYLEDARSFDLIMKNYLEIV